MKLGRWQAALGGSLVASSVIIYYLQYVIFGKPEDTFFYMFQDLAFVPVQVLLVTIMLNQLFKRREQLALQKKLNMVIGAFFSEVGSKLLKSFSEFDIRDGELHGALKMTTGWTGRDFKEALARVRAHEFAIDSKKGDLQALREFLSDQKVFLLGLLGNPNLLEHESFTELLWGVFHLTEELSRRQDIEIIPAPDQAHISGDIKRAYTLLLSEWLAYNRHLKDDYPYMYSFVVRTNPFDPDAEVEVKS